MADYQKKIDSIVEEALTQKAFSLEVIQRIKDLKDDVVTLTEENAEWKELHKEDKEQYLQLSAEKTQLGSRLTVAEGKLTKWQAREENLLAREIKQEILQTRLSETEMSRNEIKELVSLVFRNPTYVRSVTKQEVFNPNKDQYGNIVYPSTQTLTNTQRETIE